MNEYEQEWCPTESEIKAMELAKRYRDQTEAYDRTVCTGPIGRDGILPRTPRETALINRNAVKVRREIMAEAAAHGISAEQMRQAFRAV